MSTQKPHHFVAVANAAVTGMVQVIKAHGASRHICQQPLALPPIFYPAPRAFRALQKSMAREEEEEEEEK